MTKAEEFENEAFVEYTKDQLINDLESLEEALGEYRKIKYEHPNKPEQ